MESRNEILNRLRTAQKKALDIPAIIEDTSLFIDYPQDQTRLAEIFSAQLLSLSGEIHRVNTMNEAAMTLIQLLENTDRELCRAERTPLIENLIDQNEQLRKHFTFIPEEPINSKEFSRYEIGITSADYLIARTGSIFLRSATSGGRRLSVLPPTHIVIAHQNQLVSSLDDVFNKIDNQSSWSYATFITGPSRTSDIEKQLVLGAHGPKRLLVLLIKE